LWGAQVFSRNQENPHGRLTMANALRMGSVLLALTLTGAEAADPAPQQFTYPAARRADVVD
jgi:hypothetical protein